MKGLLIIRCYRWLLSEHISYAVYWIKNFLFMFEKMAFWPFKAGLLLDLIFQPSGNFSCVTLQIKKQELWWDIFATIAKGSPYLYDIGET